jgi:Sec-independent protein translocase protein TatA
MAKLRLHTEETLAILDDVTRSLGIALRAFKKEMCSKFATKELPLEAAARQRKQTSAAQKKEEKQGGEDGRPSSKKGKGKELCEDDQSSSKKGNGKGTSRLPKIFNLNTYKLHSLGDYANTIRQYGTTDSYSTQIVSRAFLLHS